MKIERRISPASFQMFSFVDNASDNGCNDTKTRDDMLATCLMLKDVLEMTRESWAGGSDTMQVEATAKAKP